MPTTTLPDFWPALPEAVLAGLAMVLLLFGAMRGERPAQPRAAPAGSPRDLRSRGVPSRGDSTARLVSWLAILSLLVVLAVALVMGGARRVGFYGMFVSDAFGLFMNVLILLGSAAAILLSLRYNEDLGIARFEFPVLVMLATTGMMVMIAANDLITLYVGLELQNLALYVVASFDRDSVRSSEAGLKYFVLGALSSGMLLYGASLVYGFAGTTGFAGLYKLAAGGAPASAGLIVGIVFVVVGLAFKVSAVPFHMWTPDVYEGAPTPVAAFFAVAPKMAALALFVRFMITPFGPLVAEWRQVIIFLSIASMLFGAVAAIAQQNIKRLMAYSSIGHIGYALIGLASATASGIRGILVYLTIYLVMNLGAWAVILCMRQRGRMLEGISDLSGLSRTQPGLALALGIFLFSLTGIPPTAGFFAKLYIFLAAIDARLTWLAVMGVVTSVVGAFYYLRIVKVMYFDEPAAA
ncbi:MAG TPA: NADH-quinone oxidoreductase subunit NuoN, partial [Stellaceae bacterium]|nr:NADH-quinone oxidoreductase subunit NuoN [Stellaceae bacterium]